MSEKKRAAFREARLVLRTVRNTLGNGVRRLAVAIAEADEADKPDLERLAASIYNVIADVNSEDYSELA